MSVPTYDQFIDPILRYLAQHPEGAGVRDVAEATARVLGLNEDDRAELLPSGRQPVYRNRAGWAHDRLKRAGLSSSLKRGFWQLTSEGKSYAASHPSPLPPDEIERLSLGFVHVGLSQKTTSNDALGPPDPNPLAAGTLSLSPDERLEQALGELSEAVAAELLEAIASCSPKFFEGLVLDLLHAMGYGASRTDLQRVGGPGDGGIDGVISLDRLGFEKVYVQAKRWQNSVGRPEIQAFYGALAGQRARKGVLITTSAFTSQALDFARSVEGIVLVDGARLSALMIEHGIGVTRRAVAVPKTDSDYFDE